MGEAVSTPTWSGLTFHQYRLKLAESPDEFEQIHRLVSIPWTSAPMHHVRLDKGSGT
jgi:hypothetical protein